MKIKQKALALSVALIVSVSASAQNRIVQLRDSTITVPVQTEKQTVSQNDSQKRGGGRIYFETFESQVLPAGWTLFNVDGLTPATNVAYVNDAWIVSDVINPAVNFSLLSTSWYTPVGTSDDWAITPSIALTATTELSWIANAPDANYADGYEVYVSRSTQDVAGCMANAAVFSIAAEASVFTPHTVDLAAAGFANESVFICFRNNSTDKFLLEIDNIAVVDPTLPVDLMNFSID
jgi:hypothetical protein